MNQMPTDGQFFTVAPPQPQTKSFWLLPLVAGSVAIVVLLLSFGAGTSQQQPATKQQSIEPAIPEKPRSQGFSVEPDSLATPTSAPTQTPETSPTVEPISTPAPIQQASPAPVQQVLDTLPIVRINAPNLAVNLRSAPSLNAPVLDSIENGSLVEVTQRQQVEQDGIVWQQIRYRQQLGWIAANFLGGR